MPQRVELTDGWTQPFSITLRHRLRGRSVATITLSQIMTPALAFKLFFRRFVCVKLANLCPFTSGRILLYRLMGVRIGRDVYIGFDVEIETNFPELVSIGDHVMISHRCIITAHMASPANTPLKKIYPSTAKPVTSAPSEDSTRAEVTIPVGPESGGISVAIPPVDPAIPQSGSTRRRSLNSEPSLVGECPA